MGIVSGRIDGIFLNTRVRRREIRLQLQGTVWLKSAKHQYPLATAIAAKWRRGKCSL